MTDDYPANESSIRYAFVDANKPRTEESYLELVVDFDRWLRAMKAKAWSEGQQSGAKWGVQDMDPWAPAENPYRH